ncbi:NUDIX domain-containing protein [Roseicyclus sp. F158]|uniref:NUDIX domain-containing protein n=1 Tax=Tropicimonas omnivorans TaxID=3075590 RepID=A0ABU3DG27_9RHOB|nr:NUDIX domain-containing protein [Roseicyclus sp. F158]MDT0682673.1 NUDIX domain-containing protein [Roseicyclus sp. F158]
MSALPDAAGGPRLAVRAVIVHRGRLLLVNAYPGEQSDLWCAPGGGVERGTGLPDNLAREIEEETGLAIEVGRLCLVNEFHAPDRDFHQVDLFFRATLAGDVADAQLPGWADPEGIVNRHLWATKDETAGLRIKPDALPSIAFSPAGADAPYDPLEILVG